MFLFLDLINNDVCKDNPFALVAYGSSLDNVGYANQSHIKDMENAVGIPVAYSFGTAKTLVPFKDTVAEIAIVREALEKLYAEHMAGKAIILPSSMFQGGRNAEHSPRIHDLIRKFYYYARNSIQIDKNNKLNKRK